MKVNGITIDDTFAEAFGMSGTGVIITADSAKWARQAAVTMSGFGTSVIGCGAEVGIDRELKPEETPDGRPGVRVLLFGFSPEALVPQLKNRVGQCVLWLGLQPLIDTLQSLFVDHDGFKLAGGWLTTLGLGALKVVAVPLVAMLLFLPLMVLTSLIFIGLAAMPAIVRHVGSRHYPELEKKQGGSLLGSVGMALGSFVLFIGLWLMSLPLYLFPPLAVVAQVALWGWLTSRVMTYDALADYASVEERQALMQQHRTPLMMIGVASGLAGALPGIVWVGGAVISVVFFPVLAAISIWLFVLIFIFTGLWFQFYCMQALHLLRLNPPMKDIS